MADEAKVTKTISYDVPEDSKEQLVEKEAKPSVLEQLRNVVEQKVERTEIEINVPEREGVSVRFSPNVTQQQLRAWRRNSGENSKDGFDPLRFACYVVGSTCTGILINDEIVENPTSGIALTFASDAILEMTGDARPIPDGIRNFYGIDPHLEATALAILDAAGYGDEIDEINPTER
ncbi:MAG: hypothetical protein HOI21_00470 [Bacteroidetes Order II. Incertae sedis bacterium]|jgi:hypothetical protein|nr:hypothetical protein [Bacteroidetes Order II. bacterium]